MAKASKRKPPAKDSVLAGNLLGQGTGKRSGKQEDLQAAKAELEKFKAKLAQQGAPSKDSKGVKQTAADAGKQSSPEADAPKLKKSWLFGGGKKKEQPEEKSFDDIVKESQKNKKPEKNKKTKDKVYTEEVVPQTEDKGAQPTMKTKGFLGVGKKKIDVEKKSGKDVEKKIKKDIFKTIKYRKRIRIPKRKHMRYFLDKAGFEGVDEVRLKKTIFKIAIVICTLATVAVIAMAFIRDAGWVNPLIFLLGLWTAVFALLIILSYIIVYVFLDFRSYKRKKELESVIADFLGLTSSNISAGMPIDRALWYAVRPKFGILAREIEEVAKSTLTGEDLARALNHFANKYDSVVLKRSVALLLEGMEGGGEIADLLTKISRNIQETRIMKKQMAADVLTYVIFISFATAAIAPVLFALSTNLLVIIQNIMGGIGTESTGSSMITFIPDAVKLGDFKLFAITMMMMSSVFSSFIIGIIRKGTAREGLKYILIFWLCVIAIYLVAEKLIGVVMSSML